MGNLRWNAKASILLPDTRARNQKSLCVHLCNIPLLQHTQNSPRCTAEKHHASEMQLYFTRACRCTANFPAEFKKPKVLPLLRCLGNKCLCHDKLRRGAATGTKLACSPGMKAIGSPACRKPGGETLGAPCLPPRCASGESVPKSAERGMAKPLSERRGLESP